MLNPALQGRTLVLCFDGTSNQYDGDVSTVFRVFYSLLKKDATKEQLCYYQPGIGTYFQPGVVAPLFQWCAKVLDEAVAWYLDAHVRGGYTFLMQNWRPGDKICIFGFSRGAYTARALAGFIHKIGLLPKDNPEQVPMAYKLFKKTDPVSVQLAAGFKQTFSRSVQIDFVGVWDTVASVGLLMSKTLPFTTTNTTIRVFRHALSLDEHRAKFQPNLYHRLSPDATRTVHDLEAEMGIDHLNGSSSSSPSSSPVTQTEPTSPTSPTSEAHLKAQPSVTAAEASPPVTNRKVGTPPGKIHPRGKGDAWRPFPNIRRFARHGKHDRAHAEKMHMKLKKNQVLQKDLSAVTDPSDDFVGLTDVLEVWFAGCHADVGGGSTANDTPHALSDIPLRWMVRQVVQAQCGVQFDNEALSRSGIPQSTIAGAAFVTAEPAAAGSKGLGIGGGAEADSVLSGRDSKKGKKIQPTLHFFAEPKEKKEALKKEAKGNGLGGTAVDAHGQGAPGAGGSTVGMTKEEQRAVRRSEESDTSMATNSSAGTAEDALEPINDELTKNRWWWILEIVPTSYTYQDGKGVWHTKWGIHLGKGRHIPDYQPKFHESVKERMEDKELAYKPRAMWKANTESYVS
ncbi:hypothetical protein BDW22DRAFT_1405674 [Trametopsis cervina]|nr:hypothetical protein BDW22DRAFT_1405674 [Trametopsis cervina]